MCVLDRPRCYPLPNTRVGRKGGGSRMTSKSTPGGSGSPPIRLDQYRPLLRTSRAGRALMFLHFGMWRSAALLQGRGKEVDKVPKREFEPSGSLSLTKAKISTKKQKQYDVQKLPANHKQHTTPHQAINYSNPQHEPKRRTGGLVERPRAVGALDAVVIL